MATKKERVGSQFETAVFAFAKGLNPDAEVLFNHSVPDRDTGAPRQCDVWINAKLGGHWPLSILVSCKDHKRKLDSGHIGTFRDEVRSTGASTGVIYSHSGFTKVALEKARSSGLSCCQIYQNEPADIPEAICFEQFLCSPQARLDLLDQTIDHPLNTWGDIFALKYDEGMVLDIISKLISEKEQEAADKIKASKSFPPDWAVEIQLWLNDSTNMIKLLVSERWEKYKARMEATLLDGSYCLTNKTFRGIQQGPSIDIRNTNPGESWIKIEDADFSLPTNRIITVRFGANVKDALQEKVSLRPIYEQLPPLKP